MKGGGGQQEWWKMSVIKCEIWSWRERKEFAKAWESRRVGVCVALPPLSVDVWI